MFKNNQNNLLVSSHLSVCMLQGSKPHQIWSNSGWWNITECSEVILIMIHFTLC